MIGPSHAAIAVLGFFLALPRFAGAQAQLNIPPGGRVAVEATMALQSARAAALASRSSLTPQTTTVPATKTPTLAAKPGSGTTAAKPASVSTVASGGASHASLAMADHRKRGGTAASALISRAASDNPGDAAADYLDITGAEVAVFPDEFVAALALASVPEAMPFNSPDLDEGMLEYEWSLIIDLQGDGRDDYMLALSAFKAPGAEALTASPLDVCMMNLWKSDGSNIDQVDVEVRAEIRGTVLILTLPDSPALPLRLITGKTRLRADTYGDSGGGAVIDSLRL